MILSSAFIERNIIAPHAERDGWEWANEYGEDGYQQSNTTAVILGDFWCRCGKHPHAGQAKRGYGGEREPLTQPGDLHDLATHHPRIWQQIEDQGYEFVWHDEWMVDYQATPSKAYRTTGDSYQWTPKVIVSDDGEWLTPDSDIQDWLEWAKNTPTRCLMPEHADQIEELGWVKWNDDSYESGWHPGQDADPKLIYDRLSAVRDEVVFVLDYNSQFYSGFSVYVYQDPDDMPSDAKHMIGRET